MATFRNLMFEGSPHYWHTLRRQLNGESSDTLKKIVSHYESIQQYFILFRVPVHAVETSRILL